MKRFVYLSVCFIIYLFTLASVQASGEFQADYDVQYAISPQGKTIVTQRVTLTNKLSNFYPKRFSLAIDSDRISNVIAYDDGGVITPEFSVKDGKTMIGLPFNAKAIGLGKSNTFSLRYEHAGIASLNGSIWELYIPGVVNDADIGRYDVSLSVPPTFGPVAYLSPLPADDGKWKKEQMIRGGIAGAYGARQKFELDLSYTLTNPGISPRLMDIALPPDTAYQAISVIGIDPKPDDTLRDDDGNWLYRYKLLPAQTIHIQAKVRAETTLDAKNGTSIPPVRPSEYLSAHPYWESTDPAILQLATTHNTPRKIYDYVAALLTYDYSRLAKEPVRLGAKAALDRPAEAVCTEFTDLFIAIARAAGIPARRNVGYAYTNNPRLRPLSLVSDVLHAWPEYYDMQKNIWVPVDPTWANTTGGVDYFAKLDFNHIVFAINGKDSISPYPAGFYHDPAQQKQDVDVMFVEEAAARGDVKLSAMVDFPVKVIAGGKTGGAVVLHNDSPVPAYTIPIHASSSIGNIQLVETVPAVLPYGTVRIPFTADFPSAWKPQTGTVTAQINGSTAQLDFEVSPPFRLVVIGTVGILCLFAVAIRLAASLWKRSRTP